MNTPTTADTITPEQIEGLRQEAIEHGDSQMAMVCRHALCGDRAAIADCADAIADAEAQRDA